jgi:hypothetical protein
MDSLICRLPIEVIYIIMGYSYNIQPIEIRKDIISYVESKKKVLNIFMNRYNDNNNLLFNSNKYYLRHLCFHIYSYICGIKSTYSNCKDNFYVFFRRCYVWKNICSNKLLFDRVRPHFAKNYSFNPNILWGLLTVDERNQFIDIHIAMDAFRQP